MKQPLELLRVLLHPNNDLQISVRHGAGHPLEHSAKQWGLILADTIRHISLAYQQTDGADPQEVREAVLRYLEADLAKPDPEHEVPRMVRFDPPGG
jgi:Domain of unknown function (DUF5076)